MSRAYQKLEFEDNEIYLGLPQYKFLLQNEISNAVFMLRRFKKNLGENEIPKASIASIKGVVCLSVFKAGLLFSGYYGSGIVTLKLSDGKWSAPSAISVSGIGWGIQIGAEVTDVMLVLSSDDAVNQFKSTGLISMTSEMEISIGFFGRGLGVYNNNDVGYGISSGLYVGTIRSSMYPLFVSPLLCTVNRFNR
jgi:lipid-binding SYLF domain-containing protein